MLVYKVLVKLFGLNACSNVVYCDTAYSWVVSHYAAIEHAFNLNNFINILYTNVSYLTFYIKFHILKL